MKVVIKTNTIKAVMLALRKEQKPLIMLLNGLSDAKAQGEKEHKGYVITDTLIDSISERVVNIHEYVWVLSQINKK